MEDKDRSILKNKISEFARVLLMPKNQWALEELKRSLNCGGFAYEKVDDIYEICIRKILQQQAEQFYSRFPFEDIRQGLINDFVRMEEFRRKDNFGDFALALYQQVEAITQRILKSSEFKNLFEKNKETFAYETISSKKYHVNYIYTNKEHLEARVAPEKMFFMEKFRAILYWIGYRGDVNYDSDFDEIIERADELYQCRNLNHRGGEKSEYQQNILDRVLPNQYVYYLRSLVSR